MSKKFLFAFWLVLSAPAVEARTRVPFKGKNIARIMDSITKVACFSDQTAKVGYSSRIEGGSETYLDSHALEQDSPAKFIISINRKRATFHQEKIGYPWEYRVSERSADRVILMRASATGANVITIEPKTGSFIFTSVSVEAWHHYTVVWAGYCE